LTVLGKREENTLSAHLKRLVCPRQGPFQYPSRKKTIFPFYIWCRYGRYFISS